MCRRAQNLLALALWSYRSWGGDMGILILSFMVNINRSGGGGEVWRGQHAEVGRS